ncbi:polyphenol oxidase I, chloroplastic-like [Cannabis sativa]|uniref:polyphenol oxidase I, chloroplastic-like n=1 Tax=Cannabis sativa TaxID=3483 RepID=UPI0029CA87F9|nr:polyphenol oxidase I, chloroplastic-like [Cannabis sativa]
MVSILHQNTALNDMASLSLTHPLAISTTPSAPTIRIPFSTKHNQLGFVRRKHACKASTSTSNSATTDDDENKKNPKKLDRRDMLIGLGGLYGVAGLATEPFASATPVAAPDLSTCHTLKDPPPSAPLNPGDVKCCPPYSDNIIDFKPARSFTRLRIRPAAHTLDPDGIAKYKKALELMRALPEDDPRSFAQQAKIHCAYCNGAYDQVGFPSQYIQVHNSWLFFPFHRWYLYFYEKILGNLINDPTFALPFWNWDHPSGYQMPSIFVDPTSSLYDQYRNQSHLPPALIDLDFTVSEVKNPTAAPTDAEQTATNLKVMYRQMVSNAKNATLFFGKPYRTGDAPNPGQGSIESIPHTPVHIWTGDNRRANWEDMGNFYSAGRDPLFYSHHANVDRMWNIWKSLPGAKRVDITDPDFLNTTFVFYDENAQLVRVKVGDSLDSRKLGYVYEDVDLPWLRSKPRATKSKIVKMLKKYGVACAADATPVTQFPITLDKTVTTVVARPKKSRSKLEKEDEEEVLVIQGIDYANNVPVKFDVYINDEDDDAVTGPEKSEFAGSFATVPHSTDSGATNIKTELNLGITELLEDIGADDDDKVKVTLVPKSGKGKVKIDGIKIDFIS